MAKAIFRSRARVIDLLGRQQIADAPTACGELFKNSLDAGARHIWVDYRENEKLLVVRDDGLGMRQEDVLEKWLVLATESRFQSQTLNDGWAKFADEKQQIWLQQPSYGEKGIGRLSVSSLARMTLLYSVWGKGSDKQAVLCLVHWHLFQHPTKLFEDLPIPYLALKTQPSIKDVQTLWNELRESTSIKQIIDDQTWDKNLRNELKNDLEGSILSSLEIENIPFEQGTTFFLIGSSETGLVDELFLRPSKNVAAHEEYTPEQLKSIHAFSTFWDPFHKHLGRDLKIIPSTSGVLVKNTFRFWEPSDFADCDQHIRIEVTAEGYAKGIIKWYDGRIQEYSKQLKHLPPRACSPGPFLIDIGYLEGVGSTSKVPADIHKELNDRLLHAGGFSIYIGNVRVQPYGAIDSDFAGFENRRVKRAGRYYFSTSRMFGGVFFESKIKTNLKEKAGREGFISNGASRGLRIWLEDMFVDMADTYLGTKAKRKDKEDLKKQRQQEAAEKRLSEEKTAYIQRVKKDKKNLILFDQSIKKDVLQTRQLIASERNAGKGQTIEEIDSGINQLRDHLMSLRELEGEAPNGVILQGDEYDSVENYLTNRYTSIRNLTVEIEKLVRQYTQLQEVVNNKNKARDSVGKRIANTDSEIRRKISKILQPAVNKSKTIEADVNHFAEQEIAKAVASRTHILSNLSSDDIVNDSSGNNMAIFEKAINAQNATFEEECKPRLLQLVDDLIHITDQSNAAVLVTSQAKELQILKERHAYIVEMAQMGLIIEAASHEYEKQVSNIKLIIKKLKGIKDSNQLSLITSLSDSFEIIDHRIRLIDPLIRRRTNNVVQLTGVEIVEFLEHRFSDYFKDDTISATNAFKAIQYTNIKRAVLLGAIHNIIDNAIFWSSKGREQRKILLSGSDLRMVISDNGPGIQKNDHEKVFEPGFSRRPYGRGLGLYIAREALKSIGFDLYSPDKPELGALEGANFIIIPTTSSSITNED